MTVRILRHLILVCALCSPAFAAETPRQIGWDDLMVKLSPAENPFIGLTEVQLEALADIAAFRTARANGRKLLPQEVSIERSSTAALEKMGIDIEGLLARRDEVAAKLRGLENTANPALVGQLIRMPGFVLPLEFSGKQVTEFLLVPWVGACIHTPPPPPNQVVYVKTDKPFETKGMFDAVWVTGRIAANSTTKSVYITDGSTDVDVGYSLRATEVEAYRR
jgi:hypothetical protein